MVISSLLRLNRMDTCVTRRFMTWSGLVGCGVRWLTTGFSALACLRTGHRAQFKDLAPPASRRWGCARHVMVNTVASHRVYSAGLPAHSNTLPLMAARDETMRAGRRPAPCTIPTRFHEPLGRSSNNPSMAIWPTRCAPQVRTYTPVVARNVAACLRAGWYVQC